MDDIAPALSSVAATGTGGAARKGRVAIIGGGWAGCAAAVTLADGGLQVTLFEQAQVLGGRARRVERAGLSLDNGQHLLLGAYGETLRLIARVHGERPAPSLYARLPLTLRPFAHRGGGPDLTAWRAPAPLHLALAMLTAHGLSWSARRALIARLLELKRQRFVVPAGQDVAACFSGLPAEVFDGVLAPLCIAALNTLPHEACARLFAGVLQQAFFTHRAMSDFLLPAIDLSALFPEAAQRYIEARGAVVRTGTTVRKLRVGTDGVEFTLAGRDLAHDAVVVAVGPHQLERLFDPAAGQAADCARARALTAALRYESITTVYLAFQGAIAMSSALQRLDDAPGQWVFDRSTALGVGGPRAAQALLAVVISAHGAHDELDHASLTASVLAQLHRLRPELPPLAWSQVIAERRATYACTPDLARPAAGRIGPGLYLAGDYTDPGLPATLEAATRSGVRAAQDLLADRAAANGNRGS